MVIRDGRRIFLAGFSDELSELSTRLRYQGWWLIALDIRDDATHAVPCSGGGGRQCLGRTPWLSSSPGPRKGTRMRGTRSSSGSSRSSARSPGSTGCRRPTADDVGQTVWLRLVEHLGDLREPAALPGLDPHHGPQRVPAAARRARPDPRRRPAGRRPGHRHRRRHGRRAARGRTPPGAAGRARRAARGPARAAPPAARRPAARLRGDQPPAGHPDRQHRPDPGQGLRAAARHRSTTTSRTGTDGGPSMTAVG